MHPISERGLGLIRRYEGFSARVYRCPGGYLTIGYGHVIGAGEQFPDIITEGEATALLSRDVQKAVRGVRRFIQAPLTQGQFDALVSFTYNLGVGTLQRSTLRRKVNRREHGEVPEEFMRWVRAGGRILPGLIKRRTAEAALYAE